MMYYLVYSIMVLSIPMITLLEGRSHANFLNNPNQSINSSIVNETHISPSVSPSPLTAINSTSPSIPDTVLSSRFTPSLNTFSLHGVSSTIPVHSQFTNLISTSKSSLNSSVLQPVIPSFPNSTVSLNSSVFTETPISPSVSSSLPLTALNSTSPSVPDTVLSSRFTPSLNTSSLHGVSSTIPVHSQFTNLISTSKSSLNSSVLQPVIPNFPNSTVSLNSSVFTETPISPSVSSSLPLTALNSTSPSVPDTVLSSRFTPSLNTSSLHGVSSTIPVHSQFTSLISTSESSLNSSVLQPVIPNFPNSTVSLNSSVFTETPISPSVSSSLPLTALNSTSPSIPDTVLSSRFTPSLNTSSLHGVSSTIPVHSQFTNLISTSKSSLNSSVLQPVIPSFPNSTVSLNSSVFTETPISPSVSSSLPLTALNSTSPSVPDTVLSSRFTPSLNTSSLHGVSSTIPVHSQFTNLISTSKSSLNSSVLQPVIPNFPNSTVSLNSSVFTETPISPSVSSSLPLTALNSTSPSVPDTVLSSRFTPSLNTSSLHGVSSTIPVHSQFTSLISTSESSLNSSVLQPVIPSFPNSTVSLNSSVFTETPISPSVSSSLPLTAINSTSPSIPDTVLSSRFTPSLNTFSLHGVSSTIPVHSQFTNLISTSKSSLNSSVLQPVIPSFPNSTVSLNSSVFTETPISPSVSSSVPLTALNSTSPSVPDTVLSSRFTPSLNTSSLHGVSSTIPVQSQFSNLFSASKSSLNSSVLQPVIPGFPNSTVSLNSSVFTETPISPSVSSSLPLTALNSTSPFVPDTVLSSRFTPSLNTSSLHGVSSTIPVHSQFTNMISASESSLNSSVLQPVIPSFPNSTVSLNSSVFTETPISPSVSSSLPLTAINSTSPSIPDTVLSSRFTPSLNTSSLHGVSSTIPVESQFTSLISTSKSLLNSSVPQPVIPSFPNSPVSLNSSVFTETPISPSVSPSLPLTALNSTSPSIPDTVLSSPFTPSLNTSSLTGVSSTIPVQSKFTSLISTSEGSINFSVLQLFSLAFSSPILYVNSTFLVSHSISQYATSTSLYSSFTSLLSSFASSSILLSGTSILTSSVTDIFSQPTIIPISNIYSASIFPSSSSGTSVVSIDIIPSSSSLQHSSILLVSSISIPDPSTPIDYNITITGPSSVYLMHLVSLSSYLYPVPIFPVVTRWFLDDNVYNDSQNISFYAPSIPVLEFTCEAFNGSYDSASLLARAEFVVRIGYISSLVLITTAEQNRTNFLLTEITCVTNQTVDGYVTYTWSYIDNNNNQQELIDGTSYLQIVDNTLTITATDPARSGMYVCSATLNGMDSTKKSGSTTVQIYSPAQVSLEQPEGDVFNLLENSLFKITCNITGLETPRIHWLVNGIAPNYTTVTLITDITEPVLNSQNVSIGLSHIQTSLTFKRVTLDIKLVTCFAIHSLGTFSNQSVFEVERLGRPCAPIQLQEVESGFDWSLLEWSLNNNCEDKYLYISSFLLAYTQTGGVVKEVYVPLEGNVEESHTFNLTGLLPNSAYQIRVSARNHYGESEYTSYITVVTSPVDKKVMFYYGKENGDSEMEHGYYLQSPALKTAALIPVGTRRIEWVYVSPFGTLSLDRRSYLFQPTSFPLENTETLFLLAPFWSDIDYRERGSISYRVYQSGTDTVHDQVLEEATRLSRSHAKADTNFTAIAAIVATWAQVEPWGYRSVFAGVNTFQAAIVTDYKQSYVLFGYNCGEMSWSSSATYPTSPVIGFNAGGVIYSNHYLSHQSSSHEIGCLLKKESSPGAIVGYQISLNLSQANPAELACFKWFGNDLIINNHLPDSATQAFPCPCNLFQATVDGRYRFDHVAGYSRIYKTHVICFVSRFSVQGNYQRCCYDLSPDSPSAGFVSSIVFTPVTKSGKQRGSILSTNPVFFSSESYQLYRERDEEGYTQCCLLSDKCELFYKRRPSQDCTGYVFRPFTWGFGDPHVISMDGFKYTFNGIGEYWYLFPIGECDFQVQARTQPIRDTAATVFTGIAVRVKDCSTVFVSLLGRDELALFVDQQNQTDYIKSTGELIDDCLSIEYFPANGTKKSEIKVVYKNGAFLNVGASIELLTMNFSLPDTCKDRTRGLIGQWDGDASNDLLMRNGTLLSPNVTDREKEAFTDSWRLTEDESLMVYDTGNYSENNPIEASPLYLDEFIENANISSEIEQLCNGEQVCLFDAVVTNDTSIAMGTVFISVDTQETVAEGSNIPPLILTPPSLFLSLDNLTTFEFNVTDEDPFSVSVSLSPLSAFSDVALDNVSASQQRLQLILTQIPVSMNVTIIANDSVGASVVSVYVVVCHCDNGGYCSELVPGTALGESGYIRSSCQCPLMYEGTYCSDAVADPCLQTACSTEACPSGTEKNDVSLKCEDFDECETECLGSTRLCENTYGSYVCTCALGYMEVGEECVDMNECYNTISPCQHQCNNSIGSFACGCDPGYALQPDQSTCKAVSNTFPCPAGYSCEDNECTMRDADIICTYCTRGTELSSDGITCIDLDECTLQPGICPSISSTCNNTFASYYCQCNQGYTASSQGACVDKNECISALPICGELELCMNNPGSYVCVPNCYRNGMAVMNGGICQDNRPPENKTITRVPTNEEIIAITFSMTLSELRLSLELRNSSLSVMYTALAATLETPLSQIEIVETVGATGTLELLLISSHFQIEPRFTAGLLRSPVNTNWSPYYTLVVNVITSQRDTRLRGNFNLTTILISGISATVSFTLLLLCFAYVWLYYCAKRVRDSVQSPHNSPERNVLHGTRAVISAYSPEYTLSKDTIESSSLTISQLTSIMSPEREYYINNEFNLLPDTTMPAYDVPPDCELKNRFTNILPPPHSRVPLFLKYGLPNSDYINANFIRGYRMAPRVYIATQAPMFNTEQDFWRMVWEHNVETIITLTEIIEHGTEQCYPYWPEYNVIDSLKSGNILIVARDKLVKEDYQVSKFILKHRGTDEVHEVTHYWYRKWPEYGVPSNPTSLVTLLLETRIEPRTSSHPVVVHCASGTGRTGVVLAVDIGMQELEERHSVDILRIASLLRQDRGGLIRTREQYQLLYRTLFAYAKYVE